MQQNIVEQIKQIQEFLEGNELYNHIIKSTDKKIVIDFTDVSKYDVDLGTVLLNNPEETIKAFEKAIENMSESQRKICIPHFSNIDKFKSCNLRIRDIRIIHDDYNKLKVVTGIIKSVSEVYPEVVSTKFECPTCGNILSVLQTRFEDTKEPQRCGCGRKGKFTKLSEEVIDSQRLIIEEEIETLEGNQQPNQIDVVLEYDLCAEDIERYNTLGSRVSITGILLTRPKIIKGKKTNELIKYMIANYIKQLDEQYKDIKITKEDEKKIIELSKRNNLIDIFVENFAPYIAGYEDVKKAIILQMFGGVNRVIKSNKQRGDFHILMIGDPSTGKTKLAKATASIALKYRYVSGVRSTRAGVTASLQKNEFDKWSVEAGAVVLANKGICVLDEFDKMSDDDRDGLHEAMEDQIITLTKIIKTQLTARTSILACANWKDSRYNRGEPIYKQIDMPDSLISRFDLYFIFIDTPNEEKDRIIIRKVIRGFDDSIPEMEINYEFWKKYIIYAKGFEPKLSFEIEKFIEDEYVLIRNLYKKRVENNINVIPITHRQGDAFRRLSEASARMHLRDVTIDDVKLAKDLIKNSLDAIAKIDGVMDIDVIEIGKSSQEQNMIWRLRTEIDKLEKMFGKQIPIDEILKPFDSHELLKAEEELERLKRNGEIYEPRRGFIAKL